MNFVAGFRGFSALDEVVPFVDVVIKVKVFCLVFDITVAVNGVCICVFCNVVGFVDKVSAV
jgi:hypothetical protein